MVSRGVRFGSEVFVLPGLGRVFLFTGIPRFWLVVFVFGVVVFNEDFSVLLFFFLSFFLMIGLAVEVWGVRFCDGVGSGLS